LSFGIGGGAAAAAAASTTATTAPVVIDPIADQREPDMLETKTLHTTVAPTQPDTTTGRPGEKLEKGDQWALFDATGEGSAQGYIFNRAHMRGRNPTPTTIELDDVEVDAQGDALVITSTGAAFKLGAGNMPDGLTPLSAKSLDSLLSLWEASTVFYVAGL